MFTGLVQDVGELKSVGMGAEGARLEISTSLDTDDFEMGESIAVNGVCLTVTHCGSGRFGADASPETLQRSNLKSLRPGQRVHLERALRLGDRLGGHMVNGHVDGLAQVRSVVPTGNSWVFTFEAGAELLRYMVEKGSVAVDGVSLTINSLGDDVFGVSVIPHTASVTRLEHLRPGDKVNIEVDILGKYVERLLSGSGWRDKAGADPLHHPGKKSDEGLSKALLARHGFVK